MLAHFFAGAKKCVTRACRISPLCHPGMVVLRICALIGGFCALKVHKELNMREHIIVSMRLTATMPDGSELKMTLDDNARGIDLLRVLELRPDTVILLKADMPIPIASELQPNDNIVIIRVVSGG